MTNEEMIENGRRLFRSAENLRKSSEDLDVLNDRIHEFLGDLDFGNYEFEVQKFKDDNERTEWCRLAQSYDVDVASSETDKRKKQQLVGTITIITRLCDFENPMPDDASHPWNEQACLIVGWHKESDWQDEAEYWNIASFDSSETENIHHRGDGLWAWREDGDEGNSGYCFAVPLFAIRNADDLERFAFRPLEILFKADDLGAAATAALRDVPVLLPETG